MRNIKEKIGESRQGKATSRLHLIAALEEKPESRLRAIKRLLRLSGQTFSQVSKVVLRGMVKENTFRFVANKAKIWGQTLIDICEVDVYFEGEIPEEGVLLVANHRSYVDIPALLSFIPVTFLAKAEVAHWPLMGWAAKTANTVFVSRESKESRKKSRERIQARLEEGLSFVVFPEGTTYEGPGILPFKKGIFSMAAQESYKIVPIAIDYEEPTNAWTGDDTFIGHFLRVFAKRRIRLRISVGQPIMNGDAEMLLQEAWNWINEQSLTYHQRIGKRPLLF